MATIKQRAVAKKIQENPGTPLGRAMREEGYSKYSASDPSKNLTETKGWKELMEQFLPDSLLAAVHTQGLQATKVLTSHTEPDKEVEDYPTRKQYLELAYKVKGRLAPDTQINQQFNADSIEIVKFTKDETPI